jgi:hypothetical protein
MLVKDGLWVILKEIHPLSPTIAFFYFSLPPKPALAGFSTIIWGRI